jgi:hypothetical protein
LAILRDAAATTATNLINADASNEVVTNSEENTEGNNKKNTPNANINSIVTNLCSKYISAVLYTTEIKYVQYLTLINGYAKDYIPYSEAKAAVRAEKEAQKNGNNNNTENATENTEGNNNGGNNANNNGNNNNNNG